MQECKEDCKKSDCKKKEESPEEKHHDNEKPSTSGSGSGATEVIFKVKFIKVRHYLQDEPKSSSSEGKAHSEKV